MRIQILPLPTVCTGDDVEEPFAIVVDQFEWPIDESASEKWKRFKDMCGARAVLVDPGTIEIVDRYAEPEPESVTPDSAEALKRELDDQQGQLAWLHGGYLNLGYWHDRAVCGGCMATIEHAEDVDAHYRLVPIEGLDPAS